jgi:pyruvate kinase
VLGLTHHEYAWRQMALEWGVIPLYIPECADVEELWDRSVEAARDAGVVDPGDRVVITAGTAVNIAGSTNVIKVETV